MAAERTNRSVTACVAADEEEQPRDDDDDQTDQHPLMGGAPVRSSRIASVEWAGAGSGSPGMDISPPQVTDPAPALELPGIDGGVTALRDLQGRPVLVSFLRHAG